MQALSPLVSATRWQKLLAAVGQRSGRVHLGFENVWKNNNTAAALRTAECAGIQNVHLIQGQLPNKQRVSRSLSKGSERWLDIRYHADTPSFFRALRGGTEKQLGGHTAAAAGAQTSMAILGADADPTATTIDNIDFSVFKGGVCVVFGNEQGGVSDTLKRRCDGLFFLPSVGLTQSYNISAACAMTVYHLRDRGVARPDLTAEEQTAVLARWLLRTVPKAGDILRHLHTRTPAHGGATTAEVTEAGHRLEQQTDREKSIMRHLHTRIATPGGAVEQARRLANIDPEEVEWLIEQASNRRTPYPVRGNAADDTIPEPR